ncbi:MAG: hypothetical protein E7218_08805 [Anaerofustis stercorihominis]|nr:hypothetical protein [Anaerofustis stercorihominis]
MIFFPFDWLFVIGMLAFLAGGLKVLFENLGWILLTIMGIVAFLWGIFSHPYITITVIIGLIVAGALGVSFEVLVCSIIVFSVIALILWGLSINAKVTICSILVFAIFTFSILFALGFDDMRRQDVYFYTANRSFTITDKKGDVHNIDKGTLLAEYWRWSIFGGYANIIECYYDGELYKIKTEESLESNIETIMKHDGLHIGFDSYITENWYPRVDYREFKDMDNWWDF